MKRAKNSKIAQKMKISILQTLKIVKKNEMRIWCSRASHDHDLATLCNRLRPWKAKTRLGIEPKKAERICSPLVTNRFPDQEQPCLKVVSVDHRKYQRVSPLLLISFIFHLRISTASKMLGNSERRDVCEPIFALRFQHWQTFASQSLEIFFGLYWQTANELR